MAAREIEPLRELSDEDVLALTESLNENMMDSLHALCFVKQVTEWKKKRRELNCSIYSPGGNYSDSTFLLRLIINDAVFCTYYSQTEEGCKRLKSALHSTGLFEGDSYVLLTGIPDSVHRYVGTSWRPTKEASLQKCHCYLLKREEASDLSEQCPDDVYVSDLRDCDAGTVNSLWPHKNDKSLAVMKEIIATSTCLGVYNKKTGQLLSWALKWYYGGIGVVQTLEEAKRKGYAKLVVSSLVSRLLKEDWPVHLIIIDGNPESTPLFTKMGFKPIYKCYFMYYNVF